MYFTTDTIADAVVTDSNETDDFSLDAATTVTIDNPPWERAFDTDRFLKLECVVARPIEQTYVHEGEQKTFKKTADALKKATWSLDNAPYPLTHPETGLITDMDDVHGFHRQPRYVEDYDADGDATVTSLYVPITDTEARSFIGNSRAVSVGVFNDLEWDTTEESVDAYQTNLYFDHVAGVKRGRCSVEDGCGIATDNDIRVIDGSDGDDASIDFDTFDEGGVAMGSLVKWLDQRKIYHGKVIDDGDNEYQIARYDYENDTFDENDTVTLTDSDIEPWVGPDIDSCSGSTCSCGCHVDSPQFDTDSNTTMTDDDNDTNDSGIDLDSIIGGMTVDAIAEENEHVAELTEDKQDAEDRVSVLEDKVANLEAELDAKEEKIEKFENGDREPKTHVVDSITELTGAWDEDDLLDCDYDELQRRKEIAEDASSSPSTPDDDDEPTDDDVSPTTDNADDDGRTVSDEYRSWA